MRYNNRITGIEGVIQGGLATFSLPTGPRYTALKLHTYINGALASPSLVIDRVRLKVNETTQWDVTAAFLLAETRLNKITPKDGELALYFMEPGRADKVDEQLTGWDTYGERSFKVELQLKTTATPTDVFRISGTRFYDNGATYARNADGTFMKDTAGNLIRQKSIMRKVTQTYNCPAGQYDIDTLPTKNPINRIFLDGASAINYVEINRDSERVWEMADFENAAVLNDYGLDASQFKYPICFDYTEQITDFLEVAKTLNVRINSDAAQTVFATVTSIAPGYIG